MDVVLDLKAWCVCSNRNERVWQSEVLKCVVFPAGEATLTDALTAAGKTYEEIALMVAEQVRR